MTSLLLVNFQKSLAGSPFSALSGVIIYESLRNGFESISGIIILQALLITIMTLVTVI